MIQEGSVKSASTTKDFPSIALRGLAIIIPGVLQVTPMKVVQAREVTGAVAENRKRRLFHMLAAQPQYGLTVWLGYFLVWQHFYYDRLATK
jgi:hypothetical protein